MINLAHRLFFMFAACLLGGAMAVANAQTSRVAALTCSPKVNEAQAINQNMYVGMSVTAGRHIRHELLPGGRIDGPML